jgi:hypothetical protein
MFSFRVKATVVVLLSFVFATALYYFYQSLWIHAYDEALMASLAESKLQPIQYGALRPQDNAPLIELGKYLQGLLPVGVRARLSARGSLANVTFVSVAVHGCGFTVDDIFSGPEVR